MKMPPQDQIRKGNKPMNRETDCAGYIITRYILPILGWFSYVAMTFLVVIGGTALTLASWFTPDAAAKFGMAFSAVMLLAGWVLISFLLKAAPNNNEP